MLASRLPLIVPIILAALATVSGVARVQGQSPGNATAAKASRAGSRGQIRGTVQDGRVTVSLGGRVVLEYVAPAGGPKCYVKTLCSPKGINVLRDSPPDHVHHHGLMFAVGVDDVDYWAEGPGCGTQNAQGTIQLETRQEDGHAIARVVHPIIWRDAQGNPQLAEERELLLVCRDQPEFPTLLVWHARLHVAGTGNGRTLWGRHYFGLGCRFVESMDKGGRFWNSAGGDSVATTNDKPAEWCAYSAEAAGQPVTVAMFDHPRNVRHPAVWFTMDQPFAYLSATLNLANEKYYLKAGETLDLRYLVAVWDGTPSVTEVSKVAGRFAQSTGQAESADDKRE
ncbi:MAG: PmoA family protein [Thermogutta sp.]|uniref:DUF6807 family protein n=1 Tax=Thermogutta sp. TaxID=1962930 RepID=UPI001998EE91|nr:DUF6807 family protein [Thermogutta sp.]MBC7353536.1 PmoA family protein [Thermogutta sp.]